jgi:hypothetical protein
MSDTREGFEATTQMFQRVKKFHALSRAATVIDGRFIASVSGVVSDIGHMTFRSPLYSCLQVVIIPTDTFVEIVGTERVTF